MLLDFLVNSVFLQNRVVLLELEALSSILTVLRGDVTAHARHARGFVLCALHDHLDPITFLCHDTLIS
jgi:hypothetical protein